MTLGARLLIGLLSAALLALAVWWLADRTLTRHDEVPPDVRSRVATAGSVGFGA